jgi:hypothetical protein
MISSSGRSSDSAAPEGREADRAGDVTGAKLAWAYRHDQLDDLPGVELGLEFVSGNELYRGTSSAGVGPELAGIPGRVAVAEDRGFSRSSRYRRHAAIHGGWRRGCRLATVAGGLGGVCYWRKGDRSA